jgi:GPH family glycoside/pentoside/hexuronide:cation symporter
MLLTFVDFAGLNVYYAYFLLNPLYAGLAAAFGFVVIGLSHWFMGYASDRTKSRFGRRRPYIMIGAPALAITAFLIFVPHWFIPPSPNPPADPVWQVTNFAYYLTTLALFKFFYAFLVTAYQAWLPEIADPDERPNVAAIENTATWIGTGVGIVLGFLPSLLFIAGIGILTSIGFGVLVTICLLCFLLYMPSVLFVRERPGIEVIDRSLADETRTVLKNRNYVKWIFVVGFWSFTIITITQVIVLMLESGLGLGLTELIVPMIAFLVIIMVFPYFLSYLFKRYSKRGILTGALLILAATIPFTAVLGLPFLGPVVLQVLIFAIPVGSCIAVTYVMRYIVLADIAHKDELETGEARAGMYEGFQGVPLNAFQAVGTVFLGWFLFVLQVDPGPPPVNFGFFWWGPVYAIFLVIAAIILRYTNIDPDFSKYEPAVKPEYS